jgi:hypothetical protein
LIIAVSGSGSNSGKTTLCMGILGLLPTLIPIKFSPRPGLGACEISVENQGAITHFDSNKLAQIRGFCYHVKGERELFAATFRGILKEHPKAAGFLIEGNAAARKICSDILIFIDGNKQWKPGVEDLAEQAQLFFVNERENSGRKNADHDIWRLLVDGVIEPAAELVLLKMVQNFSQRSEKDEG